MQRKKNPGNKTKRKSTPKVKKSNQPANRKKWADKTFDELDLKPSDY